MWPVLLIGSHSVKPSTTPNTTIFRNSIKLLIFTPMLYILNIACGLLVFIVMKTRSFGHPPYVNRFKKMLLQASLRRIFPNPLTHAGLLVDIFNLPVNRLDSILF